MSKAVTVPDAYTKFLEEYKPCYIIGIDEVGFGAIAGPVTLAAAIYEPGFAHKKIKDSKKFTTEKAREAGLSVVQSTAISLLYADIEVSEIESIGAGPAMRKALTSLALDALAIVPNAALVMDGLNLIKGVSCPQIALPKADTFVTAVGAASIAAKVCRDHHMTRLGDVYPEFEWHKNKGYPTEQHINFMKLYGVTEHHRMTIDLVKSARTRAGYIEKRNCEAA
ncbi:ribonuclease HII [bacterium]|nr:ribonuclease HII [bacterium]